MVLLSSEDKLAATQSPRPAVNSFAPAPSPISGASRRDPNPVSDASALQAPTLKLAALHFDATRAHLQDGTWRSQQLIRQKRSPRLKSIEARPSSISEAVASLQEKSDADIVAMLLDNDLNTTTFVEYVRQYQGSPKHLIPWLQTLAALATKVGLLLESTRFLTCDLQLARILMHIQVSAKALVGSKRAHAVLVNVRDDALLKVGDRGEVLPDNTETLSRGTSFAAHCARAGKPLLVGLPGSPQRSALHFNIDSGTGLRPESSLCVPCLDHLGNVLAVIQVIDRQHGGSFGRDDVVLLQRFATQCGVSLRNAGGAASFSSAVPTGQVLMPRATTHRNMAAITSGGVASGGAAAGGTSSPSSSSLPASAREKPGRACGGSVGAASEAAKSRRPRTSDAAVQCELIGTNGAAAIA